MGQKQSKDDVKEAVRHPPAGEFKIQIAPSLVQRLTSENLQGDMSNMQTNNDDVKWASYLNDEIDVAKFEDFLRENEASKLEEVNWADNLNDRIARMIQKATNEENKRY